MNADVQHAVGQPLVLIVDDDQAVREALAELLASVEIEAATFGSTRDLLSDLPDRPGCLILDIRMPGLSGLDLQAELARRRDARPIVFLSAHADVPMSVQAMKAGATDFLTKPVRDQALLDAVSAALRRDAENRAGQEAIRKLVARFNSLTPREQQVMRAAAGGLLNKQIAFELGISDVTVKLHRAAVMRKMEVSTIADLVRSWEALPASVQTATP